MTLDPKMDAGCALDALVAEKVMGWTYRKPEPQPGYDDSEPYWSEPSAKGPSGFHDWPPPYSTSIADAWLVVDKMVELNLTPELDLRGAGWAVKFVDYNQTLMERINPQETMIHESVAVAICIAALKAVGGTK